MSARKPYNDDAGYVALRKMTDGGWLVIYDRNRGGDWIDGEERYVLARYDREGHNEGLLDFSSMPKARTMIATTLDGDTCWYQPCDLCTQKEPL